MEPVFYKPRTFKTRTYLRGRGRTAATYADLPNVDSTERNARRVVWMRNQDERRATLQRNGQLGFIGALAALLVALVLSFSASTSALERAALAQEIDQQTVVAEQDVMRPASDDAASATPLSLRS